MTEIVGTQSIARAMELLRTVAEGPANGVTLAEAAEATGLHRATAHRVLAALTRERLVEQDAAHRYHPGVELWIMGEAAARRFDIRDLARPALERIASDTEDTVYLSVRSGPEAICLACCEGAFPIRTLSLKVGDRRPLGVGSGSLALLSFLPPAEREDVLASSGPQLARYARFSSAVLRRLVDQTRARGYSFVAGTIISGMSAFGVPVLDPDGHALAALSVAAIDARMTSSRRAKLVRLVQAQAAALAARLSSGRRRAPTGASSTEVKGQRRPA